MPKTPQSPSSKNSPHRRDSKSVFAKDSQDRFPIVGIGCSAGGLEALEKFFSAVPAGSPMAFIVVQHLDPNHASLLPELVGRSARLPVQEVKDRMKVQPGTIYIIPPNKDLSLLHGNLHLIEPAPRPGIHLPIDFFLRSLAEDQMEYAIGVILSGMGSDGMFGLRAIKETGGLAFVQDPAESSSNGMPRSAIDAGLADVVASASELPGRIEAFYQHPKPVLYEAPATPVAVSALEKILILLRDRCGSDFSEYKTSTLYRRIERRMALHQLDGITNYVRYARENPQELDLLFKELLIGVTSFFRDRAVWESLRDSTLPTYLAQYPGGAALRAWVPACSSGEEAYSLAIVFKEVVEKVKPEVHFTLQIYATDLDADAIDKARKGFFPPNIASDVSPERLQRFFVSDDGGFRVAKDIRDMIVFAPQNVISDPPFTRLDILSCRNLLIYLGPELQKKLLPLFHYALNPGGLLVLGSAENVGSLTNLYEPIDPKARIYRQISRMSSVEGLAFSARHVVENRVITSVESTTYRNSLEHLTDKLIQQHYAPPAVLVNGDGDILYISGRTGKYLEPPAGKVNINIHAMARSGLREMLSGAIYKALHQTQPIRLQGLRIDGNGNGVQMTDVVMQGFSQPDALRGRVLIVFYDAPAPLPALKVQRKVSAVAAAIELELQQTREAVRIAHEEKQALTEEYKSANEELQSTNEELQSTNEELTTSKEELQSINEELQTVNAELQSKVDELTDARNDMTNLLNSTDIATVFLDNAMNLRRFTTYTTHLFKLIPGDVGRPLSDIVSDLDYPTLKSDAQEVLRTLVFHEAQVKTVDDRWFRIRIMPYRTLDNRIDGVVITFIDITTIKKLEEELRKQRGT